jgi:hypothetical protein
MPVEEEVLDTEELKLPADVQARLRIGRNAAIRDAGVPDHPARDVVFKDYDGPMDDVSIKAFAERFGIVAVPEPATTAPTEQEIAAQRQILNAGGGAPAANGDIDLAVAFRNAKSQAEVMAIVAQVAGNPGFKSRDGLIGELPQPI